MVVGATVGKVIWTRSEAHPSLCATTFIWENGSRRKRMVIKTELMRVVLDSSRTEFLHSFETRQTMAAWSAFCSPFCGRLSDTNKWADSLTDRLVRLL
jgi:hypothetical protein